MIDRRDAGILAGITMVIVIAGIFAFIVPPAESDDNIIIIPRSGSNGTATSCDNIGNGGEVYKNTTDNTCYFRTLVGSSDISITQQVSTLVVDYNGSSSETTQCINVGSGVVWIKNSTSGNCYVKTVINGNGITLSNGTDIVTVSNSGVLKLVASTGLSVNQTTGSILITNTLPEATSASNVGNGANVFKNETSDVLYFKTVLVGSGLSISNGTNTITITNILPESTACANTGSSLDATICNGGNVNLKGFKELVGIDIVNNTNDISIKTKFANGTGILITGTTTQTFKTNLANGTGIQITGTTQQTVANTYTCTSAGGTSIIKTSTTGSNCDTKGLAVTSPITLTSNTNDLTIACSTCQTTIDSSDTWILLDNKTATNAITTFTSNTFTATKYIHIQIRLDTQTSTSAWDLRFNGDSGNNYCRRISFDGAADTTSCAAAQIGTSVSLASGENGYWNMFCANPFSGTEQKLCNIVIVTDDSSAPNRAEGVGVWTNTSSQITSVTIFRSSGTGTLTTSSQIQVWGHN